MRIRIPIASIYCLPQQHVQTQQHIQLRGHLLNRSRLVTITLGPEPHVRKSGVG